MSRPAHRMQLSLLGPGACAALCRLETTIELDRQLGVLVKLQASQVHGCGFCIGLHWQEARARSAGRRCRPAFLAAGGAATEHGGTAAAPLILRRFLARYRAGLRIHPPGGSDAVAFCESSELNEYSESTYI